jgi:hypothetical protein
MNPPLKNPPKLWKWIFPVTRSRANELRSHSKPIAQRESRAARTDKLSRSVRNETVTEPIVECGGSAAAFPKHYAAY